MKTKNKKTPSDSKGSSFKGLKKVPLTNSFLGVSIIGFVIFAVLTNSGRIEETWGFTLLLFFLICIIAALYSIFPSDDDFNDKGWEKFAKKKA